MSEEERTRMCRGKKRYESWARADDAAARLERKDLVLMAAYQCPYCRNWHVGHTPKRLVGKTQLYHPDITIE